MAESCEESAKSQEVTKKPKQKLFRKRKCSSDSEEENETFRSVLEDTKDLQSLRKKPNGVSVVGLAVGKKLSTVEELVSTDPFKLKTGGIVDMKNLKVKHKTGMMELDAVNLGNTFSAETNRRDEDADMMKYIEEELAKKKGVVKKEADQDGENVEKTEDVLFQVPEHLRRSSSTKSEEMLSNQMLSGIPEVDLGIEERIRNIEATEDAKQKMLRERMTKKESGTSFVPTNMAVNFVQHNRFNIEGTASTSRQFKKPQVKEIKPKPVVVIGETEQALNLGNIQGTKNTNFGNKRSDDEKATDDFHFEKFKKQFRRY